MTLLAPNPRSIRRFPTGEAFERWLEEHHARASEIWIRIDKKGSGKATLTSAEALDVALCWGWIDGIRRAFDEHSFLQRFTPRTKTSAWSQINQGHVARLVAAGRMKPPGQRQIDAARADGRWDAAYAPMRTLTPETMPADLRAAIDANPAATRTFSTLGRQSLFALAFRMSRLRTPAGRAKKITELVSMLARGDTLVREGTRHSARASGDEPASSDSPPRTPKRRASRR